MRRRAFVRMFGSILALVAPSAAPAQTIRLPSTVHDEAYYQGQQALESGNWDLAITSFSTAIRLNPKNDEAWVARAWAYHQKGAFAQCIADCTEALALNPKNSHAYDRRGAAYYDKDPCNFAEALADYRAALALNPNDPWPYNNIAWILATHPARKARDGRRARELAEKALGMSRRSGEIMDTLAAACAECGAFEEAVQWQKKALAATDSLPPEEMKELRGRLKLYEQGKPYREKGAKP